MTITTERSRLLIQDLYTAIRNGDVSAALGAMDNELEVDIPPLLPFGGTYRSLASFGSDCLSISSALLDFSSLEVDELIADGCEVVAVVRVKLAGREEQVRISEHWTVGENGKVTRLTVFYFDPCPVMTS